MVIPGAARVGRATATLVWASVVLVLADVIAYILLIRAQGGVPPDTLYTVPFVAGYLLIMAVLLWLSILDQSRLVTMRPALRAGAAAGLLVLGVVGAFSIGLPIFVAGILATIAAVRALAGPHLGRSVLAEIAAAMIAVTVLVGGFEVTQRLIVCPSPGTMGGGGSGFLTGPYHYECVNGTLTTHSGDCNGVTQGVDANGNPLSSNGC